jgi:uncharacterized protein involved in exopolysaccharide biosynthesis
VTEQNDEISLRDLYLILRRGLPLIVGVAVLAAAVTLVALNLRSERYQAETTVLVSPTPVTIQSTGNLVLEQPNHISWETYETIAFSRAVLEETVSRLDSAGVSVGLLMGSGKLTRLAGPQQPTQVAPLTISHAVVHHDAKQAAAAVDAWAAATLDTVRASGLASLETVRKATTQQMASLEEHLALLESRWTAFQTEDESAMIEARLAGLAERFPETESTLETVERDLAATVGMSQALAAVGASAGTSGPASADPDAALALLGGRGALAAETIAQLVAMLEQTGAADADLVTMVRQVELQRLTAERAGLIAEHEATETQLERMRESGQRLRERQAALVIERDKLQQRLTVARSAHTDLSRLEPVIDYILQLAPTNSRILNTASVPSAPIGPKRLLVTILAGLVGAMLGLLFVFLSAAVAEPETRQVRETVPAPSAR